MRCYFIAAGKSVRKGRGQCTVDDETGDEGPPETPFPQNVAGKGEGADEVGAKVRSLQTTSFGGVDIEIVLIEVRGSVGCAGKEVGCAYLKLCVQGIEETVGETPEEEEDGDEAARQDTLPDGQGTGAGQFGVCGRLCGGALGKGVVVCRTGRLLGPNVFLGGLIVDADNTATFGHVG